VKSRSAVESDLGRLVDAIVGIEGVLAVILFGSRARGDFDEGSDYDLMVIFGDDETMWRNRKALYANVAKVGLFTQILARSLRELKEGTDPTFLENILKEGKLLFCRFPLQIPACVQGLVPAKIVSYSLRGLPQKVKARVDYLLYGRTGGKGGSVGLVKKVDGVRVGGGALVVVKDKADIITSALDSLGVKYNTLEVFLRVAPRSQGVSLFSLV